MIVTPVTIQTLLYTQMEIPTCCNLRVGASLIARRILAISPPDAIDRTGRSGSDRPAAIRKTMSSNPPQRIWYTLELPPSLALSEALACTDITLGFGEISSALFQDKDTSNRLPSMERKLTASLTYSENEIAARWRVSESKDPTSAISNSVSWINLESSDSFCTPLSASFSLLVATYIYRQSNGNSVKEGKGSNWMNGVTALSQFRTFDASWASVAFFTPIFRQSLSSSRSRLIYLS